MGIPSYEIHRSLDGLEGKIVTGNHGFSHEMWGESIDLYFPPGGPCFGIGLHVVMAFLGPCFGAILRREGVVVRMFI